MADRVGTEARAGAELIGALRSGLERGLEPLAAVEAAAGAPPGTISAALRRISQRLGGDYREDEWGFDEDFAEAVYPLFEFLYDRWWRVQASGTENVPSHGRAMLVPNHTGSIFPFDASMITGAIMKQHPLPRWPRFMVLNWAYALPFISVFMRRVGGLPANRANAERLLRSDELLMVFPEGVKGTGKPFSDRYQVQRFGRGGFVEVALRTRTPIVPVAVVGGEEIYPKLGNARTLASLIGAPYLPITPTFPWLGPLGLIPLPSKWRIQFCEPIDTSEYPPDAAQDRSAVFEISERVRSTIQETIYDNLIERGSPFL